MVSLLLWCGADCLAQTAASKPDRTTSPANLSTLKQVRALLEANELERARSLIEAALARDPASAEAHFLKGLFCERQKDLAAAAGAYAKAIEYAPRMAEAYDRLGFVRGQQGQTQEAIRQFEQSVQIDPRLFDAQYHLGATRWWTTDLDGALVALEAAVRLQPGHAEARYYLGLTLKQKGRPFEQPLGSTRPRPRSRTASGSR